jgi:hypothetical protein
MSDVTGLENVPTGRGLSLELMRKMIPTEGERIYPRFDISGTPGWNKVQKELVELSKRNPAEVLR